MDFNVSDIEAEIAREIGQPGVGTEVVLQWNVLSAGATTSAVDGSVVTGNLVPQSLTLRAMFHSVGIGTLGVKRFNVIEEGDIILDFPANAPLDGKPDLVFFIDGKAYREKEVDDRLAQSWDATWAGGNCFGRCC